MSFTGRAAKTGNSRGFRFESALFAAHPEFAAGDLEADVIAPGRLLVRIRDQEAVQDEEVDPVLEAFLAFLAHQMGKHPERMEAFAAADAEGLEALVEGVEYDPNERLDDDFELP